MGGEQLDSGGQVVWRGGGWSWDLPICLHLFGTEVGTHGAHGCGQLLALFLAVLQPHQASVSTSGYWGEYNYTYFNKFIRKAKGQNEVKVFAFV